MAKILAVDDEPAILEMIESILNKDGHLVTKVSNPLKLNMEELHRYDLILLDIMMPGIDGFELCKRIRALVDCPILFLTAKTEENSLVNGLSLGADDYISKPFGVMELRAGSMHILEESTGNILSGWFWGGSVFKYLKRNYWLMIRNFLLRKRSTKSVNFWLKTEDRFSRRNRYWKRSLALTMRVMTVL